MKHILMIKNMSCEHCVDRIDAALKEAGIDHEISLANKTVTIMERGDAVVTAKRIISELGYTII